MRALLIAVLLTSLLPVTAAPTHTQTPPASPSAPPQPMAEVITRYPVATATLAGREIRLGEHEAHVPWCTTATSWCWASAQHAA